MGEVFLATRRGAGRATPPLVLKILLEELARDEAFIAMFHDESRIGMQLAHPNIVAVYDIGVVDQSHYLALEYVHGVDLREMQRRFAIDSKDGLAAGMLNRGSMVVWDLATGKALGGLGIGGGALALDRGRLLLGAYPGPALELWDAPTRTKTAVIPLAAQPSAAAFDGDRIAVGYEDGHVSLLV